MKLKLSIEIALAGPATLTVKAGTTVTWTNKDDIPHGIASPNKAFKKSKALDTDESYLPWRAACLEASTSSGCAMLRRNGVGSSRRLG